MTLLEHVRSHTTALVRRLATQVRKAAANADEEAVHDLRVSIRRLRECLHTFRELYPAEPRKQVKKDLRQLMKGAERVRSTDIALELLKKAGLKDSSPQMAELRGQREQFQAALREELSSLAGRSYPRTWLKALGI